MSIDTAKRRRYAASLLPIHKVPIPSGTMGWAQRANIAWIYPLYSYGIYVNDTKILYRKGSLMVEKRIEERSVAEFTIIDVGGTASYRRGQPVEIRDIYNELIFGGVIDTPEKIAMAPDGGLYHPIRCMDWHYLADKRLIALSFLATAAGTIVESIITNYLADEGIGIGNIEAGPDIVEAVFNYVRASDALDALAEKSNKIWYIDERKRLYFVARDITPTDWGATAADMTKKTPILSSGNPQYRNRQYIRGGKGTTGAQEEKFIGDGEQKAFTVGFPFQKVPTSVTVVVVAVPVGQSIGIKGIDVAKDCYWNKGDATLTFTVAPGDGKEVVVNYFGQFPILTLVENNNEIIDRLAIEGGGTGYVEDIADEPTLDDKDASLDSGLAKLARFGVPGSRFFYQTTKRGLDIGQIQPITYPLLGLTNTDMLIESITITTAGGLMFYDITAIQGPEQGSWSKFFKALADMKQEVIQYLHIGSEQILIILIAREENWAWEEEVDEFVAACHFPMATLYPRDTIYPC